MEEKNFTKLVIAFLAVGLFVCIIVIFALVSSGSFVSGQNKASGEKRSSVSAPLRETADSKYSVTTLTKEEADKVKFEAETTCGGSKLTQEQVQICGGGNDDNLSYYMNRAMSEKNAKICTLIDDIGKQQVCIDGIMRRLAVENIDENYCLQLSDMQMAASCSSEIYYYKAKNDPANAKTYCGRIKDRPFSLKCVKDFVK